MKVQMLKKMNGSLIWTQQWTVLIWKRVSKEYESKRSLKLKNGWSTNNEINSNLNSGDRCRFWTFVCKIYQYKNGRSWDWWSPFLTDNYRLLYWTELQNFVRSSWYIMIDFPIYTDFNISAFALLALSLYLIHRQTFVSHQTWQNEPI